MLSSSPNHQLIRTLTSPQYWLVFGREWPSGTGSAAECAVATAPQFAPHSHFSPDAQRVLDVVTAFAARRPQQRLVMFGEISASLAEANTSWPGMGIDWESVLTSGPKLRPQACSSPSISGVTTCCPPWVPRTTPCTSPTARSGSSNDEYEALRARLTTLLAQDWPVYIAEIQSKIIGD
jgi:hypothetical protein